MRIHRPHKKIQDYSPELQAWATEALKEVLIRAVLNIELRKIGACDKYLCGMTDDEMLDYSEFMMSEIFK